MVFALLGSANCSAYFLNRTIFVTFDTLHHLVPESQTHTINLYKLSGHINQHQFKFAMWEGKV